MWICRTGNNHNHGGQSTGLLLSLCIATLSITEIVIIPIVNILILSLLSLLWWWYGSGGYYRLCWSWASQIFCRPRGTCTVTVQPYQAHGEEKHAILEKIDGQHLGNYGILEQEKKELLKMVWLGMIAANLNEGDRVVICIKHDPGRGTRRETIKKHHDEMDQDGMDKRTIHVFLSSIHIYHSMTCCSQGVARSLDARRKAFVIAPGQMHHNTSWTRSPPCTIKASIC